MKPKRIVTGARKVAKPAGPKAAQTELARVTQQELTDLLAGENLLYVRFASVRDRIYAGAVIEPGRYTATTDGDTEAPTPLAGSYRIGLDVSRAAA